MTIDSFVNRFFEITSATCLSGNADQDLAFDLTKEVINDLMRAMSALFILRPWIQASQAVRSIGRLNALRQTGRALMWE